jgi:hypothetical protein
MMGNDGHRKKSVVMKSGGPTVNQFRAKIQQGKKQHTSYFALLGTESFEPTMHERASSMFLPVVM